MYTLHGLDMCGLLRQGKYITLLSRFCSRVLSRTRSNSTGSSVNLAVDN